MSDIKSALNICEAIHNLLTQDITVQALLGQPPRLYDHPPDDPIFPYLTYGPMRSQDESGDGAIINIHTMTLHLWSRYSGRAEVMQILDALTQALRRGPLTLKDVSLVQAQVTYTDIFRAPDGLTLHGLIRFSLMTDKEEAS